MSADTSLMPIPGPVDPVPVPRAAMPRADGKVELVGLPREAIRAAMETAGLEPKQAKLRAKQVWHWIYNRGVSDFSAMTDIAKAQQPWLAERFTITRPEVVEAQISTDGTRKWLLRSSPDSIADKLLFQYDEWEIVAKYEDYVMTGQPLDVHGSFADGSAWDRYQRGMRAVASISAEEVARRLPVPAGATAMLDIGGSHGYYSVCACRRHDGLRATILDLPEAVEHAAPILAREGMGERVSHRAGNALADELGKDAWDVVFLSQLVHHFTDEQNRDLMRRVAQALKPGGVCVLLDMLRPSSPEGPGGVGAVLDLYFAATSRSGTWPLEAMQAWQRDAGLAVEKPLHLRTLPGAAMFVGRKPPARGA